ncbi:MAG: hypothetical protein MHMPM18_004565 [Marteilia pararefringens]
MKGSIKTQKLKVKLVKACKDNKSIPIHIRIKNGNRYLRSKGYRNYRSQKIKK